VGKRATPPAEWATPTRCVGPDTRDRSSQPFEKEYSTKDGSRVPGSDPPERGSSGNENEGVAFVIDMTDASRRKRKLRASEPAPPDGPMELAHVNRVTTMVELTASMPMKLNQPLAAVVANAEAFLRWLDTNRETPDWRTRAVW